MSYLLAWFLLSVPASIFAGHVIAAGRGRDSDDDDDDSLPERPGRENTDPRTS